jgi:drug/metabolite transporter (DMT)-like permease
MTSSWMLVAGFLFATMAVFVKLGAEQFGVAELAFYRSLVTLLVATGIMVALRGTWRTQYLGTYLIRGIAGGISLVGYFYAISKLPLATAQTLNYTSPLFLVIATVVVMGERFSLWLIVAVLFGFVGVSLLLQPTFSAGNEGPAMIGLFSGVVAAWAYLSVRTLGRLGEPDWRVVFYFGVTGTVGCGLWQATTSTFHPIRLDNAWLLVGMGVTATLAQLAMTRAYRLGHTLVCGALSYSTLVFGAFATYLVWHENLTPQEWVGMAVIIGSGLLAMRVEKKEQVEEAGFDA